MESDSDIFEGIPAGLACRRALMNATPANPVIPCILPSEFAAFAGLLNGDAQFPKTYASWLHLTYRSATRIPATSIDVHSHEFADFCRQRDATPSMVLLKAFAALKSAENLP